MNLEQKAKEFADTIFKEKGDLVKNSDGFLQNVALKEAYMAGANTVINKVEDWFRNSGPFVFPEDEDTLSELLHALMYELPNGNQS